MKGKNFALNTSSCNFTVVLMVANKDIPENLAVVNNYEKVTYICV